MPDDVPFAKLKFVAADGKGVDLAPTVESVDVEDHDRAIDRARVVFDDTAARIAPIMKEGVRMQVSLGWTSENAYIFEGVVMNPKTEAIGSGQQRVTVTAYDLSYQLKLGNPPGKRPARTFNSGTLSAAIKEILATYKSVGISVTDKNIVLDDDPTFTPFSFETKVDSQSDWDFIQKLAEKYHARAFVELNDEISQFYFVSEKKLLQLDPMGTLHFCPGGGGEKLVQFEYERIGSGASPASTVTVVDPKTGDPVTQKSPPPQPDKPLEVDPAADAEMAQAADLLDKSSKAEDFRPQKVITGVGSDPDRAKQKTVQDPTRIVGFHGTGTAVGTVKLRAKGKVTIKGIAPWAEGDWYVHKVNHIFTRSVVKDGKLNDRDRSTYQTKFSATR